jgi:PAS domain S-box-containing protein
MNRVLIVEDSPTQAVMLRAVLEEAQLEALVAGDAERALELLQHESVDLVISDVVMPGKSGYELCRELKGDSELRRIPVVLLTSLNEPMDIIRGLECGADNFLTKPYRPEQLIARVEQILQSRKLRAGAAVLGIDIMFLGKRFTINSEKEQILDLLISTFEDTVQANRELQRHRAELAAAKIKLEEYARALEGQVRLSEEKYALLMENANVGIFVCGLDGKILEVNRETEKILNRSLVEIIGRNLGEFMVPPKNETFVEHWQRFVNEGSGRLGSASVERPDGETMYVALNASRVHLGDATSPSAPCSRSNCGTPNGSRRWGN